MCATAVLVVMFGCTLAAPGSAAAVRASGPCTGQSENHIVQVFYRRVAAYPLRCGNGISWGYLHILEGHEYEPLAITLTVAFGIPVPFTQAFILIAPVCPTKGFFVRYNQGSYGKHGVRPQGIITAYEKALPNVSQKC